MDGAVGVGAETRNRLAWRQAFGGVDQIVCLLELTREAVPLLRFVHDIAGTFNVRVRVLYSTPAQEVRAGHGRK